MAVIAAGLLCVCAVVSAAPAKTNYDQRQQGELNIHAQLENVVVVLIPSAKLNLLELTDDKHNGDKDGFMQLLHKLHKTELERFSAVKDDPATHSADSQNDIKTEMEVPLITSQAVILSHGQKNEEKEEEVSAVVKEMTPEPVEKATDVPKIESKEQNASKDSSSNSEILNDSALTFTIPEHLKDDMEAALEEVIGTGSSPVKSEEKVEQEHALPTEANSVPISEIKNEPIKRIDAPSEVPSLPPQAEGSSGENKSGEDKSDEKDSAAKETESKEKSGESSSSESSESAEQPMKDLIKPVSEKLDKHQVKIDSEKQTKDESPVSPGKSSEPKNVRKDKVIRYKPETKWAPELVDLLGPPRHNKELQEKQRFAGLCSPGVWDPELKTCITPGERRSRSELARFLEAMRFGIAIPTR